MVNMFGSPSRKLWNEQRLPQLPRRHVQALPTTSPPTQVFPLLCQYSHPRLCKHLCFDLYFHKSIIFPSRCFLARERRSYVDTRCHLPFKARDASRTVLAPERIDHPRPRRSNVSGTRAMRRQKMALASPFVVAHEFFPLLGHRALLSRMTN